MKKLLLLLLFAPCALAQVNNPSVRYVTTAPSGTCAASPPIQVVVASGAIFTCNNGTWAAATSGGAGGFPITIGTTAIGSGGTATTIAGLTLTTSTINGVSPTTGGSSTQFLNGAGSYSTPAGGTTTNALTLNNSGTGAASGSTFNGSGAVTLSYNTIGAAAPGAANTWTALQTFGTNISIGGVTVTGATGTGNNVFATSPTITGATLTTTSVNGITLTTGGSSSQFLNGAGAYSTPSGSGTVTASPQYDIAYYPTSGTVSTVQGAAIAGFVYGSASGAPAAATAAQAATLIQGLTGCNTASYVFTPQASDCVAQSGGSGISGLTANYIPLAGSTTTITANSHLDDGVTTASTITSSEPIATSGASSGSVALSGSTSGTVTITVPATAGTPTVTWGSSTGTPAVTASSPLTINTTTGNITCTTCATTTSGGSITGTTPIVVSSGGAVSITGAAGQVLAGATPAFTATPVLGASGTVGTIGFGNSTSGTVTLGTVTGALGSVTASLPANTGTIAETNLAQTFSALQTFGTNISIGGVTVTGATGTGNNVFSASPTFTGTVTMPLTTAGLVTTSSGGVLSSEASATVAQGGTGVATLTGFAYGNGTSAFTAATAAQLGTLVNQAQYDVLYSAGTTSAIAGAAINGFQYDSTTGVPAAATATQAATLISGLTGCSTASYVFTPQGNDCVAPGGGGGLPTGTTGQTVYYASGGTTGTATSALYIAGSAATSSVGIDDTAPVDGHDIGTTVGVNGYQMGATIATLGSSITATSTSATLSGGTSLNPNGGYALLGYQDGGSEEYICYSAASSTSITFGGGNCGNPNATTSGRGYWNTTATSFGSGKHIVGVVWNQSVSNSAAPNMVELQDGSFYFGGAVPAPASNANVTFGSSVAFPQGVYLGNNTSVAHLYAFNNSVGGNTNNGNPVLVTQDNTPSYLTSSQGITGNGTLTAITNAVTALVPANSSTGGVVSTHCKIIWSQATSGTVGFGVKASAAPTDIWVSEQDSAGAYLSPVYTTITSTTTTATSGTITPSAYGTVYATDLWIALNPGTSNNISIQLYAQASANTLTIEPGSGCTGYL